MKNQKTTQERFDYFAGLAMQSFIAKMEESYKIYLNKWGS